MTYMQSQRRSTLQLDLKDLDSWPARPNLGRISIVIVSVVALVSTIISINSPSASNNVPARSTRTDHPPSTIPAVDEYSKAVIENAGIHTTTSIDDKLPASIVKPALTEQGLANGENSATPDALLPADTKSQYDRSLTLPPLVTAEDSNTKIQVAMLAPKLRPSSSLPGLDYGHEAPDLFHGNDGVVNPILNIAPVDVPPANADNEDVEGDTVDGDQPELTAEQWVTEKVTRNDTLSQIFNRLGLRSREAYALVRYPEAMPLTKIRPGDEISVTRTRTGDNKLFRLEKLQFKFGRFKTLLVSSVEDGYQIDQEIKKPQISVRTVSARIKDSLLGSAKAAKIPYNVVYKLASIFGWQIDFAKDIHKGDSYTVVYEELILDNEVVGAGQIIAARLNTGGKALQAIRHLDEDNRVTYYAPDGGGIKGSFLRTPIKFARVTSKFTNKRFHPVLKSWKAHNGVDYGAPMKTPILATGDGAVRFVGNKNGYGNVVILRHGEKYETLYAHMNHFKKGLKSGDRVKQGDVIGYVGKTGLATGPHLHYEFRVNGRHMNPLTIELPKSASIASNYRSEFKKEAGHWVSHLEQEFQLAEIRDQRIPLAQNLE